MRPSISSVLVFVSLSLGASVLAGCPISLLPDACAFDTCDGAVVVSCDRPGPEAASVVHRVPCPAGSRCVITEERDAVCAPVDAGDKVD